MGSIPIISTTKIIYSAKPRRKVTMENMCEIKGYSCPNVKVKIDTVDYTV